MRREKGLFVLSAFFGERERERVCVCVRERERERVSMIFVVEFKEKMGVECCGVDMCSCIERENGC